MDWNMIIAMATIGTLVFMGITTHKDNKIKASQFFLQEIQDMHKEAYKLIDETDNNCIKWHHAIELLIMAEKLSLYITGKEAKTVYVTTVMSTGFRLIEIIDKIADYRFFYGIKNFKDRVASELFLESSPQFTDGPKVRIAPENLICLCSFIDKVNRVFWDSKYGDNFDYVKIFDSGYFKKSITEAKINLLSHTATKVIQKYMEEYADQSRTRTAENLQKLKINNDL